MHAVTDAWAALPDVSWATSDGTNYKTLGAWAAALLGRIEFAVASGLREAVPVTLLAAEAGELSAALRDLGVSELPLAEAIELGGELERAHRAARHLRLVRPRSRHQGNRLDYAGDRPLPAELGSSPA